MRVYGPYERRDGRKHVIHYDSTTRNKRTQSYPRYLMEQHLGRALEPWEHVDHINDDYTDNRVENLQLLSQADNSKKSAKGEEIIEFICPQCGESATKKARDVRGNKKKGKAGPYCSRRCAGKAHN